MKKLSLGKILDALPQRIALAEKDAMPIEDFLLMVFTDEIERRCGAASARRADRPSPTRRCSSALASSESPRQLAPMR
jgi:hypothetical protein